MTISEDHELRVQQTGNGSATTIPYPKPVNSDEELIVYELDTDTDIVTTLVLDTDYTVTGSPTGGPYPDGVTITLLAGAPASTLVHTVLRDTSRSQETAFDTASAFPADVMEQALDKLVMIAQENTDALDRTLKFPASITEAFSDELPLPEEGKALIWGADGVLENSDDDFDSAATDSAASAAAALASQTAAASSASSASSSASSATASAAAAAASAASVNLPALGAADTVLQVNSGGTALEYGLIAANNIAAMNSLALNSLISDNTGTGVLVFGTSPTIDTPTLTLKQSASPAPTAEGDIQWDTDNNRIVVGDGAASQTFYPVVVGSFTGTCSGAITGDVACTYIKIGTFVVLTVATKRVAGASSGTPITVSDVPAAITPAGSPFTTAPVVTDNGSDVTSPGLVRIINNSTFIVYKSYALGSFTSSANTTGFYGFTCTYDLA